MSGLTDLMNQDLPAVFFTLGDLGKEAIWVHGEDTLTIVVIFDHDHESVDPSAFAPISSRSPLVLAAESDLPAGYGHDDRVTIEGTTYRPVDFRPDGTGVVEITLHKESA